MWAPPGGSGLGAPPQGSVAQLLEAAAVLTVNVLQLGQERDPHSPVEQSGQAARWRKRLCPVRIFSPTKEM